MSKQQKDNQPQTDLPKLSAPARRALAAAGCNRLEDLTRFTEREVKAWHGIGPNALNQLRAAMEAKGLKYAGES
jgi:hypothetical protein